MSVILQQLERAYNIDNDRLLYDIVKKKDDEIIRQQQIQLLNGLNGKGKKIKPNYKSGKYAEKKYQQNSLAGFGTPDLRKSGDLFDTMELNFPNIIQYELFSGLDYFEKLKIKYDKAFELNKNSIQELRPEIQNEYLHEIYKIIHG